LSKLGYGGTYSTFTDTFDTLIYGDEDPPYVTNPGPSDGADDIPVTRNITCRVKDDNYGVEESSLDMTVTVPGRGEVEGVLTVTGNFLNFTLTFNPADDLPYDTDVTVSVDADDLEGNAMETETWTFHTESDTSVAPASLGHIKADFAE
jgi:hypothetical protein